MKDTTRPRPLLVAVGLLVLQGACFAGYALVVLVQAVRGDRTTLLGAALLALLLVAWGAGLALAARGLWAGRRWARSPVVVTELLLLAVGIPLAQGAGRPAGIVLVVVAVAVLAAVLSPPVTRLLVGPD